MRLDILPIFPVFLDGFELRKDAMATLIFNPKWIDVGRKIFYRELTINIRWPITLQFQIHITRYETGSTLEEHIDKIHEDEKQYRLMVLLKKAKRGGELICEKFIFSFSRFKLFEPTKYKHEVTEIKEGQRIVALIAVRYAWKRIHPCWF